MTIPIHKTGRAIAAIIIIILVLAIVGIGIYFASSASRGTTATNTAPANTQAQEVPKTLKIVEIGRSFPVPKELGAVTYTVSGGTVFTIKSSGYEALDGCKGKSIAQFQLSNTQQDNDLTMDDGPYKYLHFIPHPQGACGGDDGSALIDAATYMFQNSGT